MQNKPPTAVLKITSATSGLVPFIASFDASASSDPEGQALKYDWDFGDGANSLNAGPQATHQYASVGVYQVTITVSDSLGGTSQAKAEITVTAPVLPPDPRAIAPQLSGSEQPPFYENVRFLLAGTNPVQKNVDLSKLDEARVSVLRGKVLDELSKPLGAVKVTVLNHPEFGETLTRDNGEFDLLVNGGGYLTLVYELSGFLTSSRQLEVSYKDFFFAPDVSLAKLDPVVTKVTLGASSAQSFQSSPSVDSSGERTPTVILPSGVTAKIELADGTKKDVSSLSFRITEYTRGENGPQRMPADLPAGIAYTHAVELSADEAIAQNAKHIVFSKPVSYYVDNFLNIPIGYGVPFGALNPDTKLWEGQRDGVVLKILAVQNGIASLDVKGQGQPATSAELAEFNITSEELAKLGSMYAAGKSLWRVQTTHFSSIDLNFLEADLAESFFGVGDAYGRGKLAHGTCSDCGSVINVHRATLQEKIETAVLPFDLWYSSENAQPKVDDTIIRVPLTGPTITNDLISTEYDIQVGGQRIQGTGLAKPNQLVTLQWDGKDAYGRPYPYQVTAKAFVRHKYRRSYGIPKAPNGQSWAVSVQNLVITLNDQREGTYVDRFSSTTLGNNVFGETFGINGWTPSILHAFNPDTKTVYFGNGTSREIDETLRTIFSIAGATSSSAPKDGTLALNNPIGTPASLAASPDGGIYFSNSELAKVMKIDADGYLSTIAGSGVGPSSGDGGPAANAVFSSISIIAVGPDGSLYIVEKNAGTIRKVTPDGIIRRFAGAGGSVIKVEDNIPAVQVRFGAITGVVPSKDGSVYVSDGSNHVVYKITTDGILHRFAGTGVAGFSGDDGMALTAQLNFPTVSDIGLNGEVYINDYSNELIRLVDGSGNIRTVVGMRNSTGQPTQDGVPALSTRISRVTDVKIAKNGNIYYLEGGSLLRKVNSQGLVESLSNRGNNPLPEPGVYNGFYSESIMLAKDGSVFIADVNNKRIRRIGQVYIGSDLDLVQIPSESGDEIYQFSKAGKHLKTLFARTGKVKWEFKYDSLGLLVGVVDADNRLVQINRDSKGIATSIVNKYGQSVSIGADSNGWLQSLQLPSGDSFQMQYSKVGLLSAFQKPSGNSSTFTYDSKNNLTNDTDALGASKTLAREDLSNGYKSTITYPDGTTRVATAKQPMFNQSIAETFERDGTKTSWTHIKDSSGAANLIYQTKGGGQIQYTQTADLRLGGGVLNNSAVRYLLPWKNNSDQTTTSLERYDQSNLFNFKERKVYVPNSFEQATQTYEYDSNGQQWKVLSATGRTIAGNLDAQERPSRIQNGAMLPLEISYDSLGHVAQVKQGDRITSYAYDSRGFLSLVTDPLTREHRFTNDVLGRTTRSAAPSGDTTDFMYDKNNNLTGIHPLGKDWHQLVYNVVDLFSVYQAPVNGNEAASKSYVYNLSRDLQKVVRPDGKEIVYGYDAEKARVTSITLGTQAIGIDYQDYAGNPTKFGNSDNGDITQIAYADDQVRTISESGLRLPNNVRFETYLNFERDIYGRISNITNSTSGPASPSTNVSYTYDVDNLMLTAGQMQIGRSSAHSFVAGTQLGGFADTFGYSQYGEQSSYQSGVYSYSLERDLLGRIVKKTEVASGVTTVYGYSYDANDRLAAVSKNGVVQSQYSYDGNGNRLSVVKAGQTKSATYDKQDRLVQQGSAQYVFNAEGELQQKTVGTEITKYDYGLFGQLRSVRLPSGVIVTYEMNGMGQRIGKNINSNFRTFYQWQSATQLAAEVGPTGNTIARFVYGTQSHSPDYMIKNGVNYRFVKDHLGSIRFVVNAADGSIAQKIEYDEWGLVTSDSNPGFQPFGFAGGLYDVDTGLVRFGARDYDAETGRWTTKDPIGFGGGDTNLYGYVDSDPVNFVDPSGLLLMGLIDAGEGFAENAANYWAAEAVDMNNSAGFRGLAMVATGFASLWNCENSDATLATLASGYAIRVFGPFSAKGVPRSISKYRQYIRFDPPQHGKGWEFDGTIPKAIRNWFK